MAKTKKIDLALQGGGAHGAYTWGVIDRLLDDERIEIDGICGTSAGAMNGVCTVYGLKKGGRNLAKHTLVKFWHKISEAGKLSPLQPTWFDKMLSPGNMDYSPLYKLFSVTSENIAPQQYNPLGFNPLEKILNELIDFEELQKINKSDKESDKSLAKGGRILFQADRELPYSTIRKIMYTASMAGFPNLKLVTTASK